MKKHIKKINKKKIDYSGKILSFLSKSPSKSFNYKQIAAALNINDTYGRNEIIKELQKLRASKKINEKEHGKYAIIEKSYYIGTIDMTTKKTAYFVCDDLEEDIFIPQNNLNKALHGDTVKAYIFDKRKNKRPEAEIVEIIKRSKNEFVGILQMHKNFGFVVCANPRMYVDLFVPAEKINGAVDGDVVLVKMTDWPTRANNPYAKIEKILGKPGDHNTEIHAILAEYGLPSEFPIEVENYAQKLDTTITADEIAKRRDMREVLTFTIDPKDAKDFDDALSFQVLENGNYEIGIHIADVSHYVKEGTILDEEAYNRATSIYLVDRVVPMLPEVLSNFACSLRPKEEKYTFSAVFELTPDAKIVNKWFGRTVIYSNERMAYEEAQYVIENSKNTNLINTDGSINIPEDISIRETSYSLSKEIVFAIETMDYLAKTLRNKRLANGAISFDKAEVKFHLNKNDEPTGIYFKIAKDANHLIEEFMLLANRKVSEFISKQNKTFIYRVHDEPDQDKLFNLQSIISKFGYGLNFKNKKSLTQSINQLLTDVRGSREQNLVDTLTIRSMSKAQYSTQNIGHYGLAFDYYSHFTSPIRRYPDVIAHRLLQHYLDGGNSENEEKYEEKCKHCSQMENLAVNAERDSIKYMQVKFMQNHQNQEFLGVISGVTEWGIYVEIIENKCEGMIRIRDLNDDYYIFDEKQYAMIGEVTGNKLQLGDEIIVKVKNTDLIKKQLDFYFVKKENCIE